MDGLISMFVSMNLGLSSIWNRGNILGCGHRKFVSSFKCSIDNDLITALNAVLLLLLLTQTPVRVAPAMLVQQAVFVLNVEVATTVNVDCKGIEKEKAKGENFN